jgi:hypothetical protein
MPRCGTRRASLFSRLETSVSILSIRSLPNITIITPSGAGSGATGVFSLLRTGNPDRLLYDV